ncbi:hypothetical protein NX773_14385 [Massilia solisilvae]|uniref:Uncharacterized protein n=1 Tax=Massilia solisilvae TaxID=1811225 RepID=A0ABT2BLG4_9BURK|nr:hypothetical protein [Massilia solisilvae]MCS0609355.1 hypothetical protein [Massilia solisilvae]
MDAMNIHQIYPGGTVSGALALINPGETPMPLAPRVELTNGKSCIPQHYLQYEQTVESISAVLNDIEAVDDILLFCGEDDFGLYLQAGSVGHDNFKRKGDAGNRRIVYGRRWRIDTYIPTSEVIQTAFLAIKKACEHEVRELLTIHDLDAGRTGTPFSTHLDLPLMARFPSLVMRESGSANQPLLETWLHGVRFNGRDIRIDDVAIHRNGNLVVDLAFAESSSPRARQGFDHLPMTIVLHELTQASVVHEIMDALIRHSDRLVDEQFRYRGFARFSRDIDPVRLAQMSVSTRNASLRDEQFERVRTALNYDTDTRRVPSLGAGMLAHRNRQALLQESGLGGHMPIGFTSEPEAAEAG